MNRNRLREEAKKEYKKRIKGVPKRQRVPFSQFFKDYRKAKQDGITVNEDEEDFNFEDFVNTNEIGDDDLENIEEDIQEEA